MLTHYKVRYNALVIFVHSCAGAITSYLALNNNDVGFSKKQINLLYFIGILASVLPDFDVSLIILNITRYHRYLVSHSVVPYLLISLLLFLLYAVNKNKFTKYVAIVFFLGTLSHIILDYLVGGLVLYAPITYQRFGFKIPFTGTRLEWVLSYLSSKYIVFELMVFLSYCLVLLKEKNIVFRTMPLLMSLTALIALIVVLIVW